VVISALEAARPNQWAETRWRLDGNAGPVLQGLRAIVLNHLVRKSESARMNGYEPARALPENLGNQCERTPEI